MKHLYQVMNDWWNKEALSKKPSVFPLGLSSYFSCKTQEAGFLSQTSEFASVPLLMKTYTNSGFLTSPRKGLFKLLSLHDGRSSTFSLPGVYSFFLQSCAEDFYLSPSQEDTFAIWVLMHLL